MKLHYTVFNDLVNKIKKDDGWFEPIIEIIKDYYSYNGAGGSLHIVLDDGNLEDHSINWCAGYACGKEDEEGSDIANLMMHMNIKQRNKIYKNYNLYC